MLAVDTSSVNLDKAVSLYVEAASALKASVTPTSSLSFQAEYLTLRYKLLQAHAQFRESCKIVRTAPAPAIAASTAQSSRDDLLKCGLVVVQMRKCAKEFRTLADSYSTLFQSSFNADNQTLAHIQLLQNSCTIIAEAIECLFQTNRVSALFVTKDWAQNKLDASSNSTRPAVEHKQLSDTCHRISELVSTELVGASNTSSTLNCSQISLLQSISGDLVRVPLCLPRLFFQSVQNTCIKLALSPQPKGDLLLINSSSSFVLKVEGVVVQNSAKPVRKVSKVMINVTSTVISKTNVNPLIDATMNPKADYSNVGANLSCLVIPHNDYFQGPFLLSFSCAGLHTISVEASIIDENEAQWKTGPILTTSIKVVDS